MGTSGADGLAGGQARQGGRAAGGALGLARLDGTLRLGLGRGRRRRRACSTVASVSRASATSSSASVAAARLDGLLGEATSPVDVAAPGRGLGPDVAPRDRRLEVRPGQLGALGGDGVGLVDAALEEERPAEERRGLRGLAVESAGAQLVVGAAEQGLGRSAWPSSSSMKPAATSVSSRRWARPSRSTVRRAEPIMRRAASIRPRSASSTAWQRSATDSTAGAPCGDAQHADDVEAAAAGPGHRARPPERGRRGLGEDRVGQPAIAGGARRGQRGVERTLGGADLAQPLERRGVDVVRLGLAGEVADGPHGARPRRRSTARSR